MKKIILSLALVLGSIGAAQAQVYFDSGSARPNNPGAARHEVQRQHRAHPPVRARERLVRCRDGAHRVARMCRGHGGVARR
jgi:hypothetical protein